MNGLIISEDPRLELFTYSSGSGCLSFCIQNIQGNAIGRRPTEDECKRYLTEHENGIHYVQKGWKLIEFNGLPILVFPCERIADNALRVELYHKGNNADILYSYDDLAGRWSGGEWKDYALKLYTHVILSHSALGAPENDLMEVKNLSIRAVVLFWLSHEKELTNILAAT